MRDASTYRGARRNRCIRELKSVWGPEFYYARFDQSALKREKATNQKRKAATSHGGVHMLLRRGDYGAAVRSFFKKGTAGGESAPRAKAAGRGQ